MPYVVVLDADQIQAYIFASPRLRHARGGSILLLNLNDAEPMRERLHTWGGDLIYAGGGSVTALFQDRGKAEGFVLDELKRYREETLAASCTGALVEVTEEKLEHAFHEVIERAEDALRHAKAGKTLAADPWGIPLAQICPSCGSLPASQVSRVDPGAACCWACWAKETAAPGNASTPSPARKYLFNEFERWRQDHVPAAGAASSWEEVSPGSLRAPATIEEVGAASDNYIGLIACDGNQVGQVRQTLQTRAAFTAFSEALRQGTRDAVFGAVAEVCHPRRSEGAMVLPVEFVLIGGDDAVLVCPADVAIQLAREICIRLQQSMTAKGFPLGMASGVAVAKASHPLSALHSLAIDLLHLAKQRAAAAPSPASALDFQLITSSSTNPVSEVRRQEMTVTRDGDPWSTGDPAGDAFCLYSRPLLLSPAVDVDEAVRLTRDVGALHKAEVPRSTFQYLRRGLQGGHGQGIYAYLSVLARQTKEVRDALIRCMAGWGVPSDDSPWKPLDTAVWGTPLGDILEAREIGCGEEPEWTTE